MTHHFSQTISILDPNDVFRGVVLVAVPHMDDEALACGGTIARLCDKARIHFVYATDGSQAPEPVLPWCDAVSPDLGAIRRSESVAAMTLLGVPSANMHFFDLPERRLERHLEPLQRRMCGLLARIQPDHVLVPFRYDRHRDHIALNRVVTEAIDGHRRPIRLTEYFVYHYWKLLPRGDIRQYITHADMFQIDIASVSAAKRAALDCFKTQTTRFYSWQARPNLTPMLLDQVSREPEMFLNYRAALPGPQIFTSAASWIRVAHRLESPLKRQKDRAIAMWRRAYSAAGLRGRANSR